MRIRALSVFEGVVYHCYAIDAENPCRPVLEVDAITRPGDTDEGPLLVTIADYMRMAGDRGRPCLPRFRDQGRLVDHLGITHLAFTLWTPIAGE